MKKILMVVDSKQWAIGHLAKAIIDRNPQFEWRYIEVHPKGLERGEINIADVKEQIIWADVVDFEYWRTASQLVKLIPEIKSKITLLSHHNDKDLLSEDWSWLDCIVVKTKYAYSKLVDVYGKKVKLIPNGVDIDNFPYYGKDPATPKVGYCGRIVPWKGLKEIAKACYELGYPLLVMGKMDKPSYMAEIPEEHQSIMDFSYFDCSDEERIQGYKEMTIYVGNSIDGRESGTLPYLEAMAIGVPVVTTLSGIARDVAKDKFNNVVVEFENYESLKDGIKLLMEDSELRNELRQQAWKTVSRMNWDRFALEYTKIYNSIFWGEVDQVSIIIPGTYSRILGIKDIIKSINDGSYQNCEILVVWDEYDKQVMELESTMPLRQFFTNREGYNLAMARNIGIIEATGKYLVFCDSRMNPEKDAIVSFVNEIKDIEHIWIFGEKGGGKNSFVENFSMIRRQDIINGGMFNERINEYGGMSQEIRERMTKQGMAFKYLPEAKANEIHKTSLTPERRQSIVRMKNLLAKINL